MYFFFFQAEDGIRYLTVTGVQTCALPIWVLRANRYGEMKIRALKPLEGKHRTSNAEHRTPKRARIRTAIRCSMLDVRCWMLLWVHPRGEGEGEGEPNLSASWPGILPSLS